MPFFFGYEGDNTSLPTAADIDYAELAILMGGMSGAQLAGMYGGLGLGDAGRVLYTWRHT